MVYRLIFIFLALFCPMVLGMAPVCGQDANNSDRQYWIQTIVKIADPAKYKEMLSAPTVTSMSLQ